MRAVIQRVSRGQVSIEGTIVGAIEHGVVILLGIGSGDGAGEITLLADKIVNLRIFADAEGRFNHSLLESGGAALVVSQFTLYADIRRGRRPGFTDAATPEEAAPLVEQFIEALRGYGVSVASGRFGAMMQVELVNDGPVTIIIDSAELARPRSARPGLA